MMPATVTHGFFRLFPRRGTLGRPVPRRAASTRAPIAIATLALLAAVVPGGPAIAGVSCPPTGTGLSQTDTFTVASPLGPIVTSTYEANDTLAADAQFLTCTSPGPQPRDGVYMTTSVVEIRQTAPVGNTTTSSMTIDIESYNNGVRNIAGATCTGAACQTAGPANTIYLRTTGGASATISFAYTDAGGQPVSLSFNVSAAGTTPFTVGGGMFEGAVPTGQIGGVLPASGNTTGGQSVSITGSGFVATTAVSFGGAPVTSFTVDSDTRITAVTPAHTTGRVTVAISKPSGDIRRLDAYYFNLVPQAPLTASAATSPLTTFASTTMSTTGGSGTGFVSYATSSPHCRVTGNSVTALSFSTAPCQVIATKASDGYYAATSTTLVLPVIKADQATVTVSTFVPSMAAGETTQLSSTGGSGTGAVSYSIVAGGTFCSAAGTTLTANAAGICRIRATKAADTNYLAASGELDFTVTAGTTAQTPLTLSASTLAMPVGQTATLTTSGGSGTGATVLALAPATTACTLSGNTVTAVSSGTCAVTATKLGDATYASASASVSIGIGAAQTPLTASASRTGLVFRDTFNIVVAGGSGTGALTYTSTTTSVCSTNHLGTPAHVFAASAGTCVITVSKASDGTYTPATTSVTIEIGKATQSAYTATATPTEIAIGATANVRGAGGSGVGLRSFAVTAGAGICTITSSAGANATITGLAVGVCTVTSTKDGDANYLPATASAQISVGGTTPQAALTFSPTILSVVAGDPTAMPLTGGSGTGAVTYTVVTGADVCAVSGNQVTGLKHSFSCTISARKAQDATYASATTPVNLSVSVRPKAQAPITAAATPSTVTVGSTSQLSVTGGSGTGGTTYQVLINTLICSVSGSVLTAVSPGQCTVRATNYGDQIYGTSNASDVTINVNALPQAALVVSASPALIAAGGSATLSTTGGSGTGAVSYSVLSGSTFCSVSGNTVRGLAPGTCTIRALKAASGSYGSASDQIAVTVTGVTQAALTLSASPGSIAVGGTATLATSGGSGTGAVTYAVTAGGTFCQVSGNILTGLGAGDCTVTATKAGDLSYSPAMASLSVTIGRAAPNALLLSASPTSIVINATATLSTSGGSGTGAVTFAITQGSGNCSVSGGTLRGLAAGTCTVQATKAADAAYAAGTASLIVTVNKLAQTPIVLSSTSLSLVVGQTARVSVTGGSGSGALTYELLTGNTTCSLAGTTVTALSAGLCTVRATKAADASYLAASASIDISVTKAQQAPLVATATPPTIAVGLTTTLSATGGSGSGAVSFAVTAGGCSIAGTTLTGSAAGSCTVTATKAGDAAYADATATVVVTVDRGAQAAITISMSPTTIATRETGTLSSSGGSGSGATSYAVTAGATVCHITGNTLTGLLEGPCTVTATKAGDGNYLAATATLAVTVRAASQTITFGRPSDQTYSPNGTRTLSATASSGLPVTFTSSTPSVCTVSGATVTLVSVGTCTITASQDGNAGYAAAVAVAQSFVIGATPVQVSLTSSATTLKPGDEVTLTASIQPAGATGTVSFSDNAGVLCGDVVPVGGIAVCATLFDTAGSRTVKASFSGGGYFAAATSPGLTLTVGNPVARIAAATGRFVSQRLGLIAGSLFSGERQIDRLVEAEGRLSGAHEAAAGLQATTTSRLGPEAGAQPFNRMALGGRADARSSPAGGLRESLYDDLAALGSVRRNQPVSVNGSTEGSDRFSFSTSLSQVRRYSEEREAAKAASADGSDALGLASGTMRRPKSSHGAFDLWIEGSYSGFRDRNLDAAIDGHFAFVSIGADYVLNRSFLVGAFVQIDSMNQTDASQNARSGGIGWLAGPYATARLSDNVFLQARAGWGRSDNELRLDDGDTEGFASTRWLTSATLSGRWNDGAWSFQPAMSVSYLEDTAEGYFNRIGQSVPEVRSRLGQVKAGPVVSYRYQYPEGTVVEPRVGAQLIWDFASGTSAAGIPTVAGATAAAGIRGRSEVGLRASSIDGIALDLAASYDGIGATSYQAVTGRAAVIVPLN